MTKRDKSKVRSILQNAHILRIQLDRGKPTIAEIDLETLRDITSREIIFTHSCGSTTYPKVMMAIEKLRDVLL